MDNTIDAFFHQEIETARRYARRAQPVNFSVAMTAAERTRIFSQRFVAVTKRGWEVPTNYSGKQDRDRFDETATHIQGVFDDTLVASARIIFPSNPHGLPLLASHQIDFEPGEKYVEIGRVVVTPSDLAVPRKLLFTALIGQALIETLGACFDRILAVADEGMLRLYRRLGIVSEIIGRPQVTFGKQRYPVSINVHASIARWEKSMIGE